MNHDKIKNFLQENGADWIDWHHNPQAASIWVAFRNVKSVQQETY